MFGLNKKKSPAAQDAAPLLESARAAARNPALFGPGRIPDTIDGRFEAMVLHVTLILERLSGESPRAGAASQALFDLFFGDMDAALREMSVGDASVAKKIKHMGEAFYGRASAYRTAVATADPAEVESALKRNLFATSEPDASFAGACARYVLESAQNLAAAPVDEILANGSAPWGAVPD